MNRNYRYLAYATAAFLPLAALAPRSPGQKPPITLRLEAPKQALEAGQPLLLRVEVTNILDRPVNVPVSRGGLYGMPGQVYQVHVLNAGGAYVPQFGMYAAFR